MKTYHLLRCPAWCIAAWKRAHLRARPQDTDVGLDLFGDIVTPKVYKNGELVVYEFDKSVYKDASEIPEDLDEKLEAISQYQPEDVSRILMCSLQNSSARVLTKSFPCLVCKRHQFRPNHA
jgi:hypothetical protein